MKRILKENAFFAVFCFIISIYYGYRLFAITPWYDEVYTYLTFIDKGVFYSITHWPLPNNHIFFSAASALLRFAGIYISLRGISWLAAIGTLILLYAFLKQILGKGIATTGTMLYTVLVSVNSLAVQGRGYSFATFCFMLALYCILQIIGKEKCGKRYYIFFTLALYLGLYTLVSSIYWVMVACVCGGLILLVYKRYGEFWRLVVHSLVAAALTFFSYSIVWLAIGSNHLIDHMAQYQQESHVSMILKNPLACWAKGLDLMVNNTFMQGLGDRGVFLRDFKYFGQGILHSLLGVQSTVVWYIFVAIVLILSVLFGVGAIRQIRGKGSCGSASGLLALSLSGVGFLMVFAVLFVQCAYPFTRVFSFLGILFAVLISLFIGSLWHWVCKGYYHPKVKYVVNLLVAVVCAVMLFSPAYNEEYSSLDYHALDAIEHIEWSQTDTYLACDIYAKQQIQYHCILGDKLPLQEDYLNPRVILLKKNEQAESWANLIAGESLSNYRLEERTVIYENQEYIVYR